MDFVFINLDRASDRRSAFEAGFETAAAGRATLTRFPAVDGDHNTPGLCSPGEKGCFLSHRVVLERAEGPVMVFEDDAIPSPRLFDVLPNLAKTDFDLIFTDIGVGDAQDLVELGQFREAQPPGALRVVDLGNVRTWFGTTAYVAMDAGRLRLLAAMRGAEAIDVPFDLFIRKLVRQKQLRAGLCVPFLTNTRPAPSQIGGYVQRERHARLAQGFRDMLFVDRDLAECRRQMLSLWNECEETAQLYGALLAGRVSAACRPDTY